VIIPRLVVILGNINEIIEFRMVHGFKVLRVGLNEKAQNVIRSIRDLSTKVNVFESEPYNELLSDRDPGEAYCMVFPGREYVVYFPEGGSVSLYYAAFRGEVTLEWCEVLSAEWSEAKIIEPRAMIRMECPGEGHWIAVLKTE